MREFIAAMTVVLITGCASAPSLEVQSRADYGPMPENAEEIARNHMSGFLKDPASATYRSIKPPTRMYSRDGMFSRKFNFGWGTCFAVNAKNSFGGYTGESPYFFMIREGSVIQFQDARFTELCKF